ncbi:MAG: fibronectin type III domain-containing protein [Kiritimatiellae bacterium]|nr:fibronectin type III domain-containing protein [Kiritimatiellia bacterium]
MKTWKLASPVAFGIGLCMVCAHVDAAATSRYVQDGLVAHWDGVENAGAGAPHDASASTWKDLVGGKEFSLTGVTVNADRMTFAGTQSSYGTLSEADTTATFELAKTGTVEIVYASSSSADHQILLQSSTASGIAYGIYAKTTLIVCNDSASRFNLTSGLATNCVAVRYASAKPSSARANGKALTTTSANNWGGADKKTIIGTRTSKANNPFPGSIYAIRLYSRPLTDDEIDANQSLDRLRLAHPGCDAAPSEVLIPDSATGESIPTDGFSPAPGDIWVPVENGDAVFTAPSGILRFANFRQARVTGGTLYEVAGDTETAVATTASTTLSYAVRDMSTKLKMVWDVTYEDRPGIYATPTGAGARDGSSWANAFGSIQDAIDASRSGDTIYLASGVYTACQPNTAELSLSVITNRAALQILGGYAGSGAPGERDDGRSVISNATGRAIRLMRGASVNLRLERINVTGGLLNGSSGGGLYFQNSTLTLVECALRDNVVKKGGSLYGGGLCLSGGSLRMEACDIERNSSSAVDGGGGDFNHYGGGVAVTGGVKTEVVNCRFNGNWGWGRYRINYGGGLYVAGGTVSVSESTFTTNYLCLYKDYSDGRAWGAGVCANGVSRLEISDCLFLDNLAHGMTACGAIYFAGTAASSVGVVQRCAISAPAAASIPRPIQKKASEINLRDLYCGVGAGAGIFCMTNVLIASDARGAAVKLFASTANVTLSKCTIVGGGGYAVRIEDGHCRLTQCVVGDYPSGLLNLVKGSFDADHSRLQALDAVSGEGNFTGAPLLSTDGFHHPLSRAGRYTGGFFDGGSWTTDAETSPTIDRAAADAPLGDELQPNGHCANIGYDAGLAIASKSDLGNPPVPGALAVYAYPPTNITETTACARGEVSAPATLSIAWGPADDGTASLQDWANSQTIGTATAWDLLSAQIANAGGTTFYRLFATDGANTAWSDPAVSYAATRRPHLASLSVTHLTRHEATLHWTLDDDGGDIVTVSVTATPGEGDPITQLVGVTPMGEGSFRVTGLEADTEYAFTVAAANPAGTFSAEAGTATTYPTTPQARYVTPLGAGMCDGTDWANAFSNLQEAVDFCRYAGDTIYMKAGEYVIEEPDVNVIAHYEIANRPNLAILGGFAGEGAPGARVAGARSSLVRHPGHDRRMITASDSNLLFDGIEIRNGRYNAMNLDGFGIRASNCGLVFTNCLFASNFSTSSSSRKYNGCALCATAGTLEAVDCVFTNNGASVGTDNTTIYGGAVYASSVTDVRFTRCLFDRNNIYNLYQETQGGALYLTTCGNVAIDSCQFLGNVARKHTAHDSSAAYGGAICAINLARLEITDSDFAANGSVGRKGIGGAVYLADANGNGTMTTVMTRCSFVGNGYSVTNSSWGSIALVSGNLAMTNILQCATTHERGIDIRGGSANLANVTVADCVNGYGIVVASAAACTLRNSIVWGNGKGAIYGSPSVTYSCLQNDVAGEGNFVADPLFADASHYHLLSQGGYLTGGFFTGGEWTRRRATSPCIDAGDPAAPYALEPHRNGKRLNLGAYGNTAAASKTYVPLGTTVILR